MSWLGSGDGRPIAIGAMRITDASVLDAAVRAGVTVIDTADVYGDGEVGASERLIATALARADRERVLVVSKSGLRRDGAR